MKTTTIPLEIGYFQGQCILTENVEEDGTLCQRTGYYLQNSKTHEILAGISGSPEQAEYNIRTRVAEYYGDHPEEARELIPQHDNDTTQTGVHPEPE